MTREDSVTKALLNLLLLALGSVLLMATGVQEKPVVSERMWQPERPITLIVPWAAGGTSDRFARTTARVLEESLGWEFLVTNRPGGAGTLGIRSAMEAAGDGYTWTSGAARDLGTYKVQGMLSTTIDDWHLFLNFAIPQVIAVPVDSPYAEFGALLEAFTTRQGRISVATAGTDSSGSHRDRADPESHRHWPTGTSPSTAVIRRSSPRFAGETDLTALLSVRSSGYAQGRQAQGPRGVKYRSVGARRVRYYPAHYEMDSEFEPAAIYFGIFIPKEVPPGLIETLGTIWDEEIQGSALLKNFASENGLIFNPARGRQSPGTLLPADPARRLAKIRRRPGGTLTRYHRDFPSRVAIGEESMKAALIGTGFAARFHYESLLRVHNAPVEVVGAWSPNEEHRKKFATDRSITAFESFDEALDSADVLHLCSPPIDHEPAAVAALKADKHVIVEKPFTGYFGRRIA